MTLSVAPDRTAVRVLSADHYPQLPSTPGAARDRAIKVAGDLTDPEALKLCVSELVTNSVLHADPGYITVVLWHLYRDGLLRCEVIDEGAASSPHVYYDPFANSGRGLFLVEQVAITWGVYTDSAGRATWFSLPALKILLPPETGRASRTILRRGGG